MTKRRPKPPPLPTYPSTILDAVNRMDRSTDPLDVATAALEHHAFTRTVPDYFGALHAERDADVVLAALWRRGMLR